MNFTLGNMITIGLVISNLVLTIMVKLNDLRHAEKNINSLIGKVDDLCQRVSRMEGICLGRGKKQCIKK